ncbi:MAG: dockerin type I repeat-containing protein [Candidatus Omnitrophota bacterium]
MFRKKVIQILGILTVSALLTLPAEKCLSQCLYGDVDGDKEITFSDAKLVIDYSIEAANLDAEQLVIADVTGNGEVTAYDASYILRKAIGIIEQFPVVEIKTNEFIQKGKSALEEGDIVEANRFFKCALDLAPKNQEVNLFFGMTRIPAMLMSKEDGPDSGSLDSVKELLDRLGLTKEGRDFLNWTATIPVNEAGNPTLADSTLLFSEIQEYLENHFIPELHLSFSCLENVEPNFNEQLRFNSFWSSGTVEIDYGDVCCAKAVIKFFEAMLSSMFVYDLDIDNADAPRLISSQDIDIKRDIIDKYPSLLSLRNREVLGDIKLVLIEAVQHYIDASDFIRLENDDQSDDLISFVKYSGEDGVQDYLNNEDRFREALIELKDSLQGERLSSHKLTPSKFISLGVLLDNPIEPRKLLETQGIQQHIITLIIPHIDSMIDNLFTVENGFTQMLTPEEYGTTNNIEIDYGDISLLKSALKRVKSALYIICSYDFNVDTYDTFIKSRTNTLSFQDDIINFYSGIGNLTDGSRLSEAKILLKEAHEDYLLGSEFIRNNEDYYQESSLINNIWTITTVQISRKPVLTDYPVVYPIFDETAR